MAKVDVYNMEGAVTGSLELSDAIFGIEPNQDVLHRAVLNQLANRRQGTHSTKTRSEVSGGGRKPYRQKGTGRARQGSTRSAQHVGGGIIFGPKPRDYSYTLPKKVRRLAMKSALSAKVASGSLIVLDIAGTSGDQDPENGRDPRQPRRQPSPRCWSPLSRDENDREVDPQHRRHQNRPGQHDQRLRHPQVR